jgi:hypothetical protein
MSSGSWHDCQKCAGDKYRRDEAEDSANDGGDPIVVRGKRVSVNGTNNRTYATGNQLQEV